MNNIDYSINYRAFIPQYLKDSNIDISGKDLYEFGIYSGNTYVQINNELRNKGIRPSHIWGFDSFEGLPNSEGKHWEKGQFSSKEYFKSDSIPSIIEGILNRSPDEKDITTMIPGFFSRTLTNDFAKSNTLNPAFWIDVDVDIYTSARELLDFMFKHFLVREGTLISYDDWGGTVEWEGGESLAHKEVCEKYGVDCELIYRRGKAPNINKVFKVL